MRTCIAGVYRLSARSTELFEEAREKVRRFLNAADPREIVFVRSTTEAINLVAQSWGPAFLEPGDEVLISVRRASFQYRAVAAAARPDRHPPGRGTDRRDRRAGPSALRGAACRRAPGSSRSPTSPTPPAPSFRSKRIVRAGASAGRQGADRRQPGGAADCRSMCRRWAATSTR